VTVAPVETTDTHTAPVDQAAVVTTPDPAPADNTPVAVTTTVNVPAATSPADPAPVVVNAITEAPPVAVVPATDAAHVEAAAADVPVTVTLVVPDSAHVTAAPEQIAAPPAVDTNLTAPVADASPAIVSMAAPVQVLTPNVTVAAAHVDDSNAWNASSAAANLGVIRVVMPDGDSEAETVQAHHAELLLSGPKTVEQEAASPVLHHREMTPAAHEAGEASLPPSEVIRAIREGSIALRVQPGDAGAMPVWFFDDTTGMLERVGMSDQPEAIRLSINDDMEQADGNAPIMDEASRYATAVSFKPTPAMNWYASQWLQVLREIRHRWL
jgi:hypothetical protein